MCIEVLCVWFWSRFLRPALVRSTLLVVLISLSQTLTALPAANAALDDFSIPNGHFFTQAGEKGEKGFSITDDGGIPLWREFKRLGGVPRLGYPSSWRFVGADGFIYQTTQGALLQWSPFTKLVSLANVFEMPSAEKEVRLAALGIPSPIREDGSNGDFAKAKEIRLAWLHNEAIRSYFYANPNPAEFKSWGVEDAVQLYGLPMSMPVRAGPYVVQRFQRVALQLWTDLLPGMPSPGTVVRVLAGDLAKEIGLLPTESTNPAASENGTGRSYYDFAESLRVLESTEVEKKTAAVLKDNNVTIVYASLDESIVAHFLAGTRTVEINQRWRGADPRALAALLVHEGTHAADYFAGQKQESPAACYDAERRAFLAETTFWRELFGPAGKQPPADELDIQLNYVASLAGDEVGFSTQLAVLYRKQCG